MNKYVLHIYLPLQLFLCQLSQMIVFKVMGNSVSFD